MRGRIYSAAGAVTVAAIVAFVAWRDADAQSAPNEERPAGTRDEAGQVDPRADALVRQMSNYMSSLRAFSVATDHATEVVLEDGQRIQLVGSSTVTVQRPNRLRSERVGELAHLTLTYDGESVTLYGHGRNLYARAEAPPNLDAMLDFSREELDLEAPGADLLYSDLHDGLMDGVQSGIYVGTAELHGRRCHHLAFREDQVDWQIWIQDGATPLPLRYVIVTRDVESMPSFAVDLHDWDTSPEIDPSTFEFVPPPGARQIEFPELWVRTAQGQS